jgi:hypothetical protein
MTRADQIEITTIAAASTATWLIPAYIFSDLTLGEATLYLSALLLAQGLVRDLLMLLRNRSAAHGGTFQESQCLCLESAIGVAGVIAGSALLGSFGAMSLPVDHLEFFLAVTATLAIGFLLKEFVITWNPLGIRREKNPLSVIVRSPRD